MLFDNLWLEDFKIERLKLLSKAGLILFGTYYYFNFQHDFEYKCNQDQIVLPHRFISEIDHQNLRHRVGHEAHDTIKNMIAVPVSIHNKENRENRLEIHKVA